MGKYKEIINELLRKTSISGLPTSINDLKDKEFSGLALSSEERKALQNFEKFRIKVLNSISDEDLFHLTYRKFQVLANLSPWTEFLEENFTRFINNPE